MTQKIYLGVGSNLDDREMNLQNAKRSLRIEIIRESSIYETEPVGFLNQPWFLNAVWEISTDLSPRLLLQRCKKIETELGRVRDIPKGPRTIDLDILFYEDFIVREPDLIIPHPALQDRKFVLVPLNEVASNFIHPVLRKPVSQLLLECEDPSVVRACGSSL